MLVSFHFLCGCYVSNCLELLLPHLPTMMDLTCEPGESLSLMLHLSGSYRSGRERN